MLCHSINIEKLPKRIKIKFQTLHSKLDGADFKIIISQKSNAFESSHSDESDIGGITSRFWKKNFRPKNIDLVQSVQSYLVYRYPTTSAKHFSFANTAVDSVTNRTKQQFPRKTRTCIYSSIRPRTLSRDPITTAW